MNERTSRFINQLQKMDWFNHLGEVIQDDVALVKSWDQALYYCSRKKYEDLLLREANRITETLFKENKDEFNKWNEKLKPIKKAIVPLIKRVVRNTAMTETNRKRLQDILMWNLLYICMAVEYRVHSRFYDELSRFYLRGHFPCGWEGNDYPSGRFRVY